MTIEKLIELVYRVLPYSSQITDLDLNHTKQIRFKWRGTVFAVNSDCKATEIRSGGMMVGSNEATLLGELLSVRLNDGKGS